MSVDVKGNYGYTESGCKPVVTVGLYTAGHHSSGEGRLEKKDQSTKPKSVTYALTQSFSHVRA